MVLLKWSWTDLNFSAPDATITFVMLALCFDYALFFWTRFSFERRKYPDPTMMPTAVFMTLATSGYVIMLSMLVLVVAYVSQAFFPNHNNLGFMGMVMQLIFGISCVSFYSLVIPSVLAVQYPSLFDEPTSEGLQKR